MAKVKEEFEQKLYTVSCCVCNQFLAEAREGTEILCCGIWHEVKSPGTKQAEYEAKRHSAERRISCVFCGEAMEYRTDFWICPDCGAEHWPGKKKMEGRKGLNNDTSKKKFKR